MLIVPAIVNVLSQSGPIGSDVIHSQLNVDLQEKFSVSTVEQICLHLASINFLRTHPRYGHGQSYSFPGYGELAQEEVNYGALDYHMFGFSKVLEQFNGSVLPIVVVKMDGSDDIGTCFLCEFSPDVAMIITAAHCVENMSSITIESLSLSRADILDVFTPVRSDVNDLCCILIKREAIPDTTKLFKFGEGAVLDEVLTLGYPPIPGFHNILVSEPARIAGNIRATSGHVVSDSATTYFFPDEQFFLISARIKGGNSGGPVVNRNGLVIGVVSSALKSGDTNTNLLDSLGYGIVISSINLNCFVDACRESYLNGNVSESIKKTTLSFNYT